MRGIIIFNCDSCESLKSSLGPIHWQLSLTSQPRPFLIVSYWMEQAVFSSWWTPMSNVFSHMYVIADSFVISGHTQNKTANLFHVILCDNYDNEIREIGLRS